LCGLGSTCLHCCWRIFCSIACIGTLYQVSPHDVCYQKIYHILRKSVLSKTFRDDFYKIDKETLQRLAPSIMTEQFCNAVLDIDVILLFQQQN